MTTHDFLRKRLLEKAGVFEPIEPAPSFSEICKMQWSEEFEHLMRNRMAMGYFRYGSLQKQIGKNQYDNIGSIEKRLALYRADHNREHLVDIANIALVEFVVHPEYPFNPSDDGIHTKKIKKVSEES